MKTLRDEVLNHALQKELELLHQYRAKSVDTKMQVYFDSLILECKQMMTELKLNGTITF